MSSVADILAQLRASLETDVSEKHLVECIADGLQRLRCMYHQRKREFTGADIEFLQQAGEVLRTLESFIGILSELEDVYDGAECLVVCERLMAINATLGHFPVAGRVAKEIRQLQERLPALREREAVEQMAELARTKRRISAEAPKCRRGHAMVLRDSPNYFWGCSRFPWCTETVQISEEHSRLLIRG